MDARETAFNVIYNITEEDKPSHVVLKEALKTCDLDKRDRAFVTRLTEGTLERLIFVDHVIGAVSNTKVKKLKPIVRTALRMSVYQMFFMDSVPDSAAVNEGVKIVKKQGLSSLSGFTNGVLRNIVRRKDELKESAEKAPYIKYSCPKWIYEYLRKTYGKEKAEAVMQGFNRDPAVSVRVNLSKISRDELAKRLEDRGVTVLPGCLHDYSLILKNTDDISGLPEFNEGLFQVQDESSMFVAEFAEITGNELIIDMCAAPGGKSLHAADIIKRKNGTGRVISRDVSDKKVELINENVKRAGFDCIKTEVHDALDLDESLTEKADVVLLDAPCSGLGIVARKPDIRYKMTAKQQSELAELQKEMLKVAVRYLKSGGKLVYSTCTINKRENEENMDFAKNELGLKCETSRQFLPGVDECDGFFVARLRKQ